MKFASGGTRALIRRKHSELPAPRSRNHSFRPANGSPRACESALCKRQSYPGESSRVFAVNNE
eukprot:30850-Pelagococcus_subviridis.AAC.44